MSSKTRTASSVRLVHQIHTLYVTSKPHSLLCDASYGFCDTESLTICDRAITCLLCLSRVEDYRRRKIGEPGLLYRLDIRGYF